MPKYNAINNVAAANQMLRYLQEHKAFENGSVANTIYLQGKELMTLKASDLSPLWLEIQALRAEVQSARKNISELEIKLQTVKQNMIRNFSERHGGYKERI